MPDEARDPDPTVQRRRLRAELRDLREAVGMTQRDVAAAMEWSQSKVIRIELGTVNISKNDLEALLRHYGVDSERIAAMVELARASRRPPQWAEYKSVVEPTLLTFLGYESSAAVMWNFEPFLVPGLLQTEDYARTVVEELSDEVSPAGQVDRLVELRLRRQRRLLQEARRPRLQFLLDENVIRRVVGGNGVMKQQLERLRSHVEEAAFPIGIVPFERGIYPRMRVPYVVFQFDNPRDEDVLYLERSLRELIVRENEPEEEPGVTPRNYLEAFSQLQATIKQEETIALLDDAIARLTPPAPESGRGVGEPDRPL